MNERPKHNSNTITTENFLNNKPQNPTPYTWQAVNRDNFVSWLSTSFAISQGRPPSQFAFMEWTRINHNFDYRGTLENFLGARTDAEMQQGEESRWNFLSHAEQQLLADNFRAVRRHATLEGVTFNDVKDNREVLDYIYGQVDFLLHEEDRQQMSPDKRVMIEGHIPQLLGSMQLSPDEFRKRNLLYVGQLRQEDTE